MARLLDSNILIYAAGDFAAELLPVVLAPDVRVADVTWVEVLGYHGITPTQDAMLQAIRRDIRSITLDDRIIEHAIGLRRRRKMSLGDAIVAGTALTHGLTLATHNVKDFAWIDGLSVVDPLA